MQPQLVSVNFRLTSPELGLDVAVRLRHLDGRWLAIADFDDEPEVGLGARRARRSRPRWARSGHERQRH